MELLVFSILSGIALTFVVAGALSGDRINILPGSAILFIIGIVLSTGAPLEMQDGIEYDYKEVNGSYELGSETNTYRNFSPSNSLSDERFSQLLGLSYLAIALYYFVISVSRINFRTLMEK